MKRSNGNLPATKQVLVPNKHLGWGTVCAVIGAVAIIWSLLLVLAPTSHAATPYGGCDEAWRYSHSQGAADCRRAGWTIRPHFTISPTNRLRATDLPACRTEDDKRGCYYNARKRGNHRGDSFVVSQRGEVFYVSFR